MFGNNVPQVDVHELKKLNKKKILLIDIREPEDFIYRHVPNSVNLPAKTIKKNSDEVVIQTAYIICDNGSKSKRLVSSLARKGKDVVWVKGGVQAFAHHYKVVKMQKVSQESK